jgi:HEAT repeat protein
MAVKVLREGLDDRSSAVKFTACMVIGNRRLHGFQTKLRQLYADSGPRVQSGVIYALARLGHQRHVEQLAVLLHSKDPTTRANAAMVLGRLGDPTAIGLLRTDSDDPIHAVRLAVTSALARLGYHRAISSIIALSYSRYAIDHLAALNTSRSLETPLAANVLLNGLRDPLPAGQLIAARGLGQRGSEQGEKIARHYIHSSNADYRVLAALALGWIPDGNNAPRLVHMLHDSSEKVRIAAAAGLLHLYHLAKLGQEYAP